MQLKIPDFSLWTGSPFLVQWIWSGRVGRKNRYKMTLSGLEINFCQQEQTSIADTEVWALEGQIVSTGLLHHLLLQRGTRGFALKEHPGPEVSGINDYIKSPHPSKNGNLALHRDATAGYPKTNQPNEQTLTHRLFGGFDQPLPANGIEDLSVLSHELCGK